MVPVPLTPNSTFQHSKWQGPGTRACLPRPRDLGPGPGHGTQAHGPKRQRGSIQQSKAHEDEVEDENILFKQKSVFFCSVEIWQDHTEVAEWLVKHMHWDTMDSEKLTHQECWGNPARAIQEIVASNARGDQGVPTCGLFSIALFPKPSNMENTFPTIPIFQIPKKKCPCEILVSDVGNYRAVSAMSNST